jgi:hypothetical protein
MAKGKNKDHVSFWFWFFALFVTAIPCIGWIMIFVWAFVGQNESRKNYYKALIVWTLIMITICSIFASLGIWTVMEKNAEMLVRDAANKSSQHSTPHK